MNGQKRRRDDGELGADGELDADGELGDSSGDDADVSGDDIACVYNAAGLD